MMQRDKRKNGMSGTDTTHTVTGQSVTRAGKHSRSSLKPKAKNAAVAPTDEQRR